MKILKRLTSILCVSIVTVSCAGFLISASSKAPVIKMADLPASGGEDVQNVSGIQSNKGVDYSGNVVQFDSTNGSLITYDLKGEYEFFKFNIVRSNATNTAAGIDVGIYADGVRVFELKQFSDADPISTGTVNLQGVGKLSISTASRESDAYVYFVDSVFEEAETPAAYHTYTTILDVPVVENVGQDYWRSLGIDSQGHPHLGVSEFNVCSHESYCSYALNKQFVQLKGCFYLNMKSEADAATDVIIFLDDAQAFIKENVTLGSSAIYFDLDVTNVTTLKFYFRPTNGNTFKSFAYVSDTQLLTEKIDHVHTKGEWVVSKQPTCSEAGEQYLPCMECGAVLETKEVPVVPHTPDGVEVTISEPTCTTAGKKVQHCTVCGHECEIQSLPPLGHQLGEWETVEDSTCDKEGLEQHRCTVCGEVVETRKKAVKEHTPGEKLKVTHKATCKAQGLRQTICTECGKVLEEEKIPVTEHDWTKWTTIDGNFWDTPVVKERVCRICGQIEHKESKATAWVKPTVIILVIVAAFVIVEKVRLKKNMPLEPNQIDAACLGAQAFRPEDLKGQLYGINPDYEVTPAHLESPQMPPQWPSQLPQGENPTSNNSQEK